MTTARCIRCGRQSEIEYGTDGLPYCSSCSFYGLNKQCWRCRMYLPAAELQQYQGQWMCPYCVQDARADQRKQEESYGKEEHVFRRKTIEETCERCGRTLDATVYILNGRRLCRSCLETEQDKWSLVGGGPSVTPYRITVDTGKAKERSLLSRMISNFLAAIGLGKPARKEIVVYDTHTKMGAERAKPMAEEALGEKVPALRRAPRSEGLIRSPDKKISVESKKKPAPEPEVVAADKGGPAEVEVSDEERRERQDKFGGYLDRRASPVKVEESVPRSSIVKKRGRKKPEKGGKKKPEKGKKQ